MISRSLKASYYFLLHYPMRINSLRHRMFTRNVGTTLVHLGPGKKHYIEGWVNVDANFTTRTDIWADISSKLPFQNEVVDAFYSHHVIEHLADAALISHFADMFRCLKPGGIIRVGGPNGDAAIAKFCSGDLGWFGDFPDKKRSIGGRFANFILCRGEHLSILTRSYLTELAEDAGFVDVSFCSPGIETNFPRLISDAVLTRETESTPQTPHTLLLEARKPN